MFQCRLEALLTNRSILVEQCMTWTWTMLEVTSISKFGSQSGTACVQSPFTHNAIGGCDLMRAHFDHLMRSAIFDGFHYSLMREIHNKIIIFCVILDMSIGHHRYSQLLKSLQHRTVSILGQGCSAFLNWLAICLLLKREWRHRARISRKLDQYQLFSMYSIGNYHF